ncbi:hypothetical protein NVP1026O_088 [Vibrio phage 1.026.O._10N.222.49.C7]|uniref:Uncharacterized protein n=1 Tax=Vibrio phage 1.026.O._10N.222.49.C7 TaxID=1881421 RepID=A0A2I7QMQ6_9CAUD|nr:hypothetical protein HYP57_gp097 [Vibrio phage 1.026.O._10N.222.49.C7]AUR82679.1 hypothetical protein NVP1026O_088 [Vibrio phage 1.026.O._10N.222.49.C7]
MISVYMNGMGSMFLLVHNNKAWWYNPVNASENYVPDSKSWWSRDVEYSIGTCTHLFDVDAVSDILPVYEIEILLND